MARNRGRRLASPLPKNTVTGGELILDPSQPQNNLISYPKEPILDVRSIEIHNIHDPQRIDIGADLSIQLMTFLKAQAHALHLDHVQITAPKAKKYLVHNSETAFKMACKNQEIRAWLEEHVIDEGRRAAMVVGMYTYENATYVQDHRNELQGQAGASVPTDIANVKPSAGVHATFIDHRAFGIPEEHVFAIEYKWIRFKPWTKKKVEEARLDKGPNRWEVFFGDRSKGSTAEEKENIFEFSLEDDCNEEEEDEEAEEQVTSGEVDDDQEHNTVMSMNFDGSVVDDIPAEEKQASTTGSSGVAQSP